MPPRGDDLVGFVKRYMADIEWARQTSARIRAAGGDLEAATLDLEARLKAACTCGESMPVEEKGQTP